MEHITLFGDRLLNPTLKSHKDIILNKIYLYQSKYEYNLNIYTYIDEEYVRYKVKDLNSDKQAWIKNATYVYILDNWISTERLKELTDEEKVELL